MTHIDLELSPMETMMMLTIIIRSKENALAGNLDNWYATLAEMESKILEQLSDLSEEETETWLLLFKNNFGDENT